MNTTEAELNGLRSNIQRMLNFLSGPNASAKTDATKEELDELGLKSLGRSTKQFVFNPLKSIMFFEGFIVCHHNGDIDNYLKFDCTIPVAALKRMESDLYNKCLEKSRKHIEYEWVNIAAREHLESLGIRRA